MLSAAACGGEGESGREADPETTRATTEETTAETTRAREETSTEETTQASAPVEVANTLCGGFSSQESAQEYFDGPEPWGDERQQLDPDGNGIACDEPGNEAGVPSRQPDYGVEQGAAGGDQYGMLDLANCQLAEAQASMTPAQFEAFQYELTDEMVAALEQDIDTNIQTMLLERGYTCGGTAEGIIERYNAGR
jgi:hypothetical protein